MRRLRDSEVEVCCFSTNVAKPKEEDPGGWMMYKEKIMIAVACVNAQLCVIGDSFARTTVGSVVSFVPVFTVGAE
jgi:hypothetical protein